MWRGFMPKNSVSNKRKIIRGEANEIISIMAILCIQALERRYTRHAKNPSTVVDIFKDKDFLNSLKEAYEYDKDLRVLANNFSIFLKVINKVAKGG
jgi:hypothetical protein